jgi:hypothetical protein
MSRGLPVPASLSRDGEGTLSIGYGTKPKAIRVAAIYRCRSRRREPLEPFCSYRSNSRQNKRVPKENWFQMEDWESWETDSPIINIWPQFESWISSEGDLWIKFKKSQIKSSNW